VKIETEEEEDEEGGGAGIDLRETSEGDDARIGTGKMSKEWDELSKVEHGDTYPLLYSSDGQNAVAYAQISWDDREQALVYRVIEPPLYPGEKEQLKTLEQKLEEKLEVDLMHVGTSSQDYLRSQLERVLDIFDLKLDDDKKMRFEYYIFRDFIGLNQIEPLMHDPNIEDVSCDGINIPLYIQHRNPEYGSLVTNIMFETKEELDSFAIKLAQRCGKAISVASPLLDGMLPDGSRVQQA
jgi:flagellar protein FlaI